MNGIRVVQALERALERAQLDQLLGIYLFIAHTNTMRVTWHRQTAPHSVSSSSMLCSRRSEPQCLLTTPSASCWLSCTFAWSKYPAVFNHQSVNKGHDTRLDTRLPTNGHVNMCTT